MRSKGQGLYNIIRFNWHFYVIALVVAGVLWGLTFISQAPISYLLIFILASMLLTVFVSLAVSYYVYDQSNLYQLDWLDSLPELNQGSMVNIHAGFDETSALLAQKYPKAQIKVLDFYDAKKHTEVSIKRARAAYPPYPNTLTVKTRQLPLTNQSVDRIFLLLAAHEIRDQEERHHFFQELNRILQVNGQIVIAEHLRDWANFCAYNIGYFHFLPANAWQQAFKAANLRVQTTQKITPFITVYILTKHGNTS